jgi:hypothetical protein
MTGDESKVGERGDPGSGELVNDGAQAEARDVLVTRIVDGRAMPEDWGPRGDAGSTRTPHGRRGVRDRRRVRHRSA